MQETDSRWNVIFFKTIGLITICASLVACASSDTQNENRLLTYFTDRANDAGDIVTMTAGLGLGVKGQAGPLHLGAQMYFETWGWRSGWISKETGETAVAYLSLETTMSTQEVSRTGEKGSLRGKGNYATGGGFVSDDKAAFSPSRLPLWSTIEPEAIEGSPRSPLFSPYYTQVDVCVGLLGHTRIGVNPGEVIDFALGWFCLDLFNDDYAW